MDLSTDLENETVLSSNGLGLSATTSESPPPVCPHCRKNINEPAENGSQLHPSIIPNSHVSFEEFKNATNAAFAARLEGESYAEVKVLLLNWWANDIGLKRPEAGSLILDETKNLMGVFQGVYHYDTEHYLIPSQNPQTKVQRKLGELIDELSDKSETKEVLFIVYYNGHGAVKDGRLIWSA